MREPITSNLEKREREWKNKHGIQMSKVYGRSCPICIGKLIRSLLSGQKRRIPSKWMYFVSVSDDVPFPKCFFGVILICFSRSRQEIHHVIHTKSLWLLSILPDMVGEVFEVKQYFAGDVMIFVVHFAAELHHHLTLYKKIAQYNLLDASYNVLEFIMYSEWATKATPCTFNKLATSELLLPSLMSFGEKLCQSLTFQDVQHLWDRQTASIYKKAEVNPRHTLRFIWIPHSTHGWLMLMPANVQDQEGHEARTHLLRNSHSRSDELWKWYLWCPWYLMFIHVIIQ